MCSENWKKKTQVSVWVEFEVWIRLLAAEGHQHLTKESQIEICRQDESHFDAEKGRQDADSGFPDDDGREVRGIHLVLAEECHSGDSEEEQLGVVV